MRIGSSGAVALALLGGITAVPALGEMSPATPDNIAQAVAACMAAAGVGAIDEAQLAKDGWSRAATTEDGEAITVPVHFFGKTGNDSVLLINANDHGPAKICAVVAELTDTSEYQRVIDAIDALEGVEAIKQDRFDVTFSTGNRVILSQITGTREKPSVRIGVSAFGSEN